jgi:hypothetical protein
MPVRTLDSGLLVADYQLGAPFNGWPHVRRALFQPWVAGVTIAVDDGQRVVEARVNGHAVPFRDNYDGTFTLHAEWSEIGANEYSGYRELIRSSA